LINGGGHVGNLLVVVGIGDGVCAAFFNGREEGSPAGKVCRRGDDKCRCAVCCRESHDSEECSLLIVHHVVVSFFLKEVIC